MFNPGDGVTVLGPETVIREKVREEKVYVMQDDEDEDDGSAAPQMTARQTATLQRCGHALHACMYVRVIHTW